MKVAIASDHAGFQLKDSLITFLKKNHDVIDLGTNSPDSVDYPDFAKVLGKTISEKKADCGILICGSGIGMCIAVNRFKDVRAVVVTDEFDAEMSRKHNNANVACLGARKITEEKAKKLLKIWFSTDFEGGRHETRVKKL